MKIYKKHHKKQKEKQNEKQKRRKGKETYHILVSFFEQNKQKLTNAG